MKITRDFTLVYSVNDLIPIGYTNSYFQTDKDERKSTSRYAFTLFGGAVFWRSIKQFCIAHSTVEAEYVVVFEVSKEIVWLRKFLVEFGVVLNMDKPITRYSGNSRAVSQCKEPGNHKKRKHIEKKYNLIRDFIRKEE